MTDELKPCPWCGSAPKYLYNQAYDVHCIWCPNKMCGVRPDVDSYVSKESAVENWNQRPVEDALRAKWESVPWVAIDRTARYGKGAYMPGTKVSTLEIMGDWCIKNMPK